MTTSEPLSRAARVDRRDQPDSHLLAPPRISKEASKIRTRSTLSISGLLVMSLLLATPVAARTLKIATALPEGQSWLVEMRKAGDRIKQRTQGRVKLKFYPGAVMGNDKTVMRKIRAGQLHGGALTSGALAAVYPDIELYSLPLLFRSWEEVDYVRARLDDTLAKGLEKKGFVALSISHAGFAYVFSKKRVSKVEDLAGRKIWMVEDDKMSEIAFEIAGVSPIPLQLTDVLTSLQTGLIDTVAAPPTGAIALQWHTNVKYMTDVPLMYLTGVLALDKRAFDKLKPGDQAILREEVSRVNAQLEQEYRDSAANAREALQNQGIEFVEASSAEEVARWRDISEQAIEKLRGMDRYDESIMARLLGLVEEFRAQAAAAPAGE